MPLDEQPEDSVVPPEHRESAPSLAHLLTVVPGTSRVHPVRPSVQPDHASIDHDNNRPVWWIDLDDGTRTILLTEVTLEDAATVAARIIASTT